MTIAGVDQRRPGCYLTFFNHLFRLIDMTPNHQMKVFGHYGARITSVFVVTNDPANRIGDQHNVVVGEATNFVLKQWLGFGVKLL